MKKQIKILLLSIVLILISTLTVYAADAIATLGLDKSEVKKGDTFTVTVEVACEEGINGIQGLFSYDTENLEIVEKEVIIEGVLIKNFLEVVEQQKWYNCGEGLKFEVISSISQVSIKSGKVVKATFKVKDTAEVGSKAKVTVSDIVLDSDAATNSTKEIGTKEVEVTITDEEPEPVDVTLTGIRIKTNPIKVKYKVGEKFDKTGLVVEAVYSDGTTKEVTNYTYAPAGELKLTDNKIIFTYTEDGVTKTVQQTILVEANAPDGDEPNGDEPAGDETDGDEPNGDDPEGDVPNGGNPEGNKPDDNKPQENKPSDKEQETTKEPDDTQANKPIDKAGIEQYAMVLMVLIALIAVISYKKYNEYKNI